MGNTWSAVDTEKKETLLNDAIRVLASRPCHRRNSVMLARRGEQLEYFRYAWPRFHNGVPSSYVMIPDMDIDVFDAIKYILLEGPFQGLVDVEFRETRAAFDTVPIQWAPGVVIVSTFDSFVARLYGLEWNYAADKYIPIENAKEQHADLTFDGVTYPNAEAVLMAMLMHALVAAILTRDASRVCTNNGIRLGLTQETDSVFVLEQLRKTDETDNQEKDRTLLLACHEYTQRCVPGHDTMQANEIWLKESIVDLRDTPFSKHGRASEYAVCDWYTALRYLEERWGDKWRTIMYNVWGTLNSDPFALLAKSNLSMADLESYIGQNIVPRL